MDGVAHTAGADGGPWRRFAVVFALLAVASEVAYFGFVRGSAAFAAYLSALATLGGGALNALGRDVVVDGATIHGPRFIVEVANGCDAFQICALLAAAIVAVPAPLTRRLRGLACGIAGLQALNLARIVTLYWIGAAWPGAFRAFHVTLWPAVLLATTVATWGVWVIADARPHDR